ncbi:hypothetical protein ACFFU2_12655 [Halomonas alkalicola]|uniref:Uncharacterized protein n=1 Tax=Halomonas alkalicola TaxID=1930622 RepID=A0ABY9H1C1_9GAMM|nr:hypothetical protein [Halomonas alkalicola]WLI72260.1 hypothetical protein B6N23_10665 [Halomonas alkalicola]
MTIAQQSFGSRHDCLSHHATQFGRTFEQPVLVQVNSLSAHHRPKSDDPDFWAVWSGRDSDGEMVERKVDWKTIADDWQQISVPAQAQGLETNDE